MRKKDYSGPILAVVFVLCSVFYLWTAEAFQLPWTEHHGGAYFAWLADAFLQHQTSLLVQPRPEMFTLRNPYDPAENYDYQLHDASFFHRKYYLYWGISPTLLWYLPIKVLTGRDGCDVAACSIFAVAGLMFYLLLFYEIRRRHFPNSSAAATVLLALLLAFGNVVPFVLRRPIMYESAILCGFMLTAAFLYFLYKGAFEESPRPMYLLASGTALALAFLCRPQLAVFGLATGAVLWLFWKRGIELTKLIRLSAIACIPVAVAIGVQAWYNLVRFDSPFEYGLKYQLGSHLMTGSNFSLSRAAFGSLYYLFSIPKFSPFFPFMFAGSDPIFHPLRGIADRLQEHIPLFLGVEAVVGILFIAPILLANGLTPIFLRDRKIRFDLRLFLLAILAAALIVFVFDLCFYGPTMRYEVDFAPGLLFPVVVLALWLEQRTRGRWWKAVITGVVGFFALYTVIVSAALSITGYSDNLRRHEPDQFDLLTKVFSPLERLAGPEWKVFGGVRARITVPACASDQTEPLVATGIPGEGDEFSLRCTKNPGEFVVERVHHWIGSTKMGKTFSVPLNEPMLLEITAPALYPRPPALADMMFFPGASKLISTACVVRVDGSEVFREEPCLMDQNTAKSTYLFVNGIGLPGVADRYSGQVLSVERIPPK